jgi:hypothetical protein
LYSSNLKEERMLADKIQRELNTIIRSFVKRADDNYGKALQRYLADIKIKSSAIGKKYLKSKGNLDLLVDLVEFEPEGKAKDKIVSAILYEQSNGTPYRKILAQVRKMKQTDKNRIIKIFSDLRKNRRHRPSRAFEMTEYTFDFLTNFGMFRDLHRHRVLTLERQLLTTDHGYTIPDEIIEMGLKKEFDDCMYKSK